MELDCVNIVSYRCSYGFLMGCEFIHASRLGFINGTVSCLLFSLLGNPLLRFIFMFVFLKTLSKQPSRCMYQGCPLADGGLSIAIVNNIGLESYHAQLIGSPLFHPI